MFTLWFTGANCPGRSEIAKKVKEFIEKKGLTVIYLDKDNCGNARWSAYIAELLNKQGVVVIVSFESILGLRTFAKDTITKYLEVWVTESDKTHVFSAEHCDIRVDADINSVESCASLVASYLYLHKVLFFSEDGIDPITKIREDKE